MVSERQVIELCGRKVPWRLRRVAGARGCRVTIGSDGVRVTLNKRAPLRTATDLLRAQADWVVAHLDAAATKLDQTRTSAGLAPGQILLEGKPTTLAVRDLGTSRASVRREAATLTALCPHDQAADVLERWLRREAKRVLIARVHHLEHVAAGRAKRIAVRDQRTRWGSCSTSGTVSFNWRLLMAPPAALDYVVIHELVHLDVPNHSSAFWRQVRAACPSTDQHRRWFREHEALLARPLATVLAERPDPQRWVWAKP